MINLPFECPDCGKRFLNLLGKRRHKCPHQTRSTTMSTTHETERTPYYGVYRVKQNGEHEYVSRTATTDEKLAMEIAADLSIGRVIRPDGRELQIPAHPHVHKLIPDGPPSITCPRCGSVSFNPNDIEQKYCGACHRYHDDAPDWSGSPAPDDPDNTWIDDATGERKPAAPKGWDAPEAQGGPSPQGWDAIEPGPEQSFAPTTDVTVTLTLDELRELIHACHICDNEGQSIDDVAFNSAWDKLNQLEPENADLAK